VVRPSARQYFATHNSHSATFFPGHLGRVGLVAIRTGEEPNEEFSVVDATAHPEAGFFEIVLAIRDERHTIPLTVNESTGEVGVTEGSLEDFGDKLIAGALAVRLWLINREGVDGVLGEIEAKP
jgi:hypothetical protein